MPTYTAPVKDMQFLLHDLLKISEAGIPGYSDLDRSFTEAVAVVDEFLAGLGDSGSGIAGIVDAQRMMLDDRELQQESLYVLAVQSGWRRLFQL